MMSGYDCLTKTQAHMQATENNVRVVFCCGILPSVRCRYHCQAMCFCDCRVSTFVLQERNGYITEYISVCSLWQRRLIVSCRRTVMNDYRDRYDRRFRAGNVATASWIGIDFHQDAPRGSYSSDYYVQVLLPDTFLISRHKTGPARIRRIQKQWHLLLLLFRLADRYTQIICNIAEILRGTPTHDKHLDFLIHSYSFISTKVNKMQLYSRATIKWDGDRIEKKVNVIHINNQILEL